MGFGFNLIGFPVLILTSLGLLTYFFIAKRKRALKILGVVWLLTGAVIATGLIADHYRTPIRLTKANIIGEYRIDTNFFSGTNAKWQYKHYSFSITPADSIIFYVTNQGTTIKTFKEKIVYSTGPPDLWKVKSDTAYHVIRNPPTLYRGHDKYYHVFKSGHFGNMFFRKFGK
jgi:hypothetical protein